MNSIENKVEQEIASLDKIGEVKVSAMFKDDVLKKFDHLTLVEEEEYFNWFTPKIQFAAMLVVLLVNATAIYYLFSSQDSASLENFVEQYELTSKSFF